MAQYQYNAVQMPPAVGGIIAKGMGFVQGIAGDPLFGVQSVRFEQRPEWIECFCPCCGETENQYTLVSTDPTGFSSLQEIGSVVETSECAGRFFCQCWRPMKLTLYTPQQAALFESQRQYKIPAVFCLPCVRPEIVITSGGQLIGFIRQPYMICGRSGCPFPLLAELDICDEQGNLIFYVSGQFCQCGWIARLYVCPRCFGPCQFISFDIYSPTQEKIGSIRNIYGECCTEVYTKADRFVIDFPANCTFNQKVLLINAVLTIDYDEFEYTFCNLP